MYNDDIKSLITMNIYHSFVELGAPEAVCDRLYYAAHSGCDYYSCADLPAPIDDDDPQVMPVLNELYAAMGYSMVLRAQGVPEACCRVIDAIFDGILDNCQPYDCAA